MKHLPLQLRDEHLERWLFLWQANCHAQLPADTVQEMIDLSQHIGGKLRWIGALKYRLIRAGCEDIITAGKLLPRRLLSLIDCMNNEAAEVCKQNLQDKHRGLHLRAIRDLTTFYEAI
jgi:hypothetical protein